MVRKMATRDVRNMTKKQEVLHALGYHTWLTLSGNQINGLTLKNNFVYKHRRCIACKTMQCFFGGEWVSDESFWRKDLIETFDFYEKNGKAKKN